jgi:formylglycine-generating enzyme required for sulfatase activity/nitrate/TMAO reductase-like tetraheme cytochrome c subunit
VLARLKNLGQRHPSLILIGLGICLGVAIMLSGKAGVQATSSDRFCDQSCHAHPDATQTWIRSPHYSNKSGVVTHCIDCHLPGEGITYYTEKARLGGQDIYGKLFKDLSQINWQSMQTLTQARTFTYDSACVRCHANLFSAGLSKKGVDGHLHYQRSKDKMRCINCHLHTGHYRGKQPEEGVDEAAAHQEDLDKAFPASPQGFTSYTEVIPGSAVKIRMVAIPGGTFQMGSPESEPYRHADEGPVHTVKISPFWMERTEVTWREYEVYLLQRGNTGRTRDAQPPSDKSDGLTGPSPPYGSPDQGWGRGSRPAITMTYYAATKFCEWLSQITGKKYRLPTEAEWEYAARAGTTSPYFFSGDPDSFTSRRWLNHLFGVKTAPLIDFAWYQGDSADQTHPTGLTKPNAWGVADMLGNIREFCLDWYDPQAYSHYEDAEVKDPRGPESGKEHVVRGGSYRSDAADLRCAARDHTREEDWLLTDPQSPKSIWWYSDCTDVGFRVVREYDASVQTAVSHQAEKVMTH